jgi:DNA-directed RNA polymerase subunit RPC12/RpoP
MKAIGILMQYACFKCRKSFKRPQFSGANSRFMTSEQQSAQHQEARQFENEREYKCPNCGGAAHFMGQDFKAPKITDAKTWAEVQAFIVSGKVYYRGT